jgi:virginiamycin B lyase|tara:strand:- start:16 stop:1671 length:1656 start_codon:yes stop_codon:yes gene_type:complete
MKTRTKGIIFFAVVAGIMLASGITIAIPSSFFERNDNTLDSSDDVDLDSLGYTGDQRLQFCGVNDKAKSNSYVKEYKIPIPCTQPLAITTVPDGTVWFAQTNTGMIAKFDPSSETFTQYENPDWDRLQTSWIEEAKKQNVLPIKLRSMMWGMDYSPDGSIWYTDGDNAAIWKFSLSDESYHVLSFPREDDSEQVFPQRLEVDGSRIIINDLFGSKISFFDFVQVGQAIRTFGIPSPISESLTSDFTIDSKDNVWYTTWIPNEAGVLVKFDYPKYEKQQAISSTITDGLLLQEFIEFYQFPSGMDTPNGIAVGPNEKIWIADTSGNFFFSFDLDTEKFTKYVTSIPHEDSYGNLKLPSYSSNPYWIERLDEKLVMNEHNANRIAVFDPITDTMVEYTIPSRNTSWADCEGIEYCGISQVFGFTVDDKKIWFTEWVENNIGVIDTSIQLPFDIDLNTENIILEKGETAEIILEFSSTDTAPHGHLVNISTTSLFDDLIINPESTEFSSSDSVSESIRIQVTASDSALPDTHKILLGAYNDEIAISKFITVTIE